ncbi:tripartite tricarboxylate transporter substrate binding protein [Halomonas sp. A29]|uniref:tripartite tricarboxylate transporter substrate binding protein n=1 Tax=Halomonas sp. A29 TaxID=3102786 RepID=UPI00398B024A
MSTPTHPFLSRVLKSALLGCFILGGSSVAMAADSDAPVQVVSNASTYRFIVGFGAGGIPDLGARLIAEKLAERQGVPAVVINRPGVGGTMAAQDVLAAPADGTTILSVTPAHATAPAIYREMRYDTLNDFAPVTLIGDGPALLVVPSDSAYATLEDLIDAARANPGGLDYSSAGVGSSTHFAAELLKQQADIDVLHIPYRGVSEALTEVMASRVDFTMAPYVAAVEYVKEGRVRALAVTSRERVEEMPDLPTAMEAGLPDYEWAFWYGLLVPAQTPDETVQRLHQETAAILRLPDVGGRLEEMGVTVSADSPEAFQQLLEAEYEKFKQIAEEANIVPE